MSQSTELPKNDRGQHADNPAEIPKDGWWDIAKRVKNQLKDDHVQIVAAGVAFYFFLALFPTLAAAISVYGLAMDPSTAGAHIEEVAAALPGEAQELIVGVAEHIAGTSDSSLGWGAIVSLVISLWSANKGSKGLFEGLNIAYNEKDERGYFTKIANTLLVTLVGVVGGMIAVGTVAIWPVVSSWLGLPDEITRMINWLRWLFLGVLVMLFLAFVYRIAPDRDSPRIKWVSLGSVIAALLWLGGSALFSLYVSNFGSFGETYGSFAAVIILQLWLFLTAFIILLGAEINSEMEHQTSHDTTVGEWEPMGERGAYMADHVAKGDQSS